MRTIFGSELTTSSEPGRARRKSGLVPAVDVENYAMTRDVVLNADVEVVPACVKKAASPFGVQVIECADASAAVGLIVGVISVVEARPEVVVVGIARSAWSITVFMDNPVA